MPSLSLTSSEIDAEVLIAECQLCKEIPNEWEKHHKREIMRYSECQHFQISTSLGWRDINLLFQCALKVVARGIHGEDDVEHYQHFAGSGVHRIIHMVAAIFMTVK